MMSSILNISKFHICSALRVAVETNVVEILRQSGPEVSLHRACFPVIDSQAKLYRALRLKRSVQLMVSSLINWVGPSFNHSIIY